MKSWLLPNSKLQKSELKFWNTKFSKSNINSDCYKNQNLKKNYMLVTITYW